MKFLTFLAIPLAFSPVNAQNSTTTTPVGVVKHTLKAGKYNLLGLTLHNPRILVSKFTGVSGNSLTDSSINFDNRLESGKTYILEITSGALTGTIQEITVWNGNTITTSANLETDGLQVNDTYQMREAATLQQIFGAHNEVGLKEGSSVSADLIWVPNENGFSKYYYHPGTSFPATITEGWKLLGDATYADQANIPLVYSDAVIVESRSNTDLNMTISGSVITTPVSLSIVSDYTFISSVFPVGSTLENSSLADSMQHGSSATADLLWIPTDDATSYTKYYYHPGTSFPATITAGWKLLGDTSYADQGNVSLKNGMIIEKRSGTPYNAKINPPASYSN